MKINILATYRELDTAGYDMLKQLSYREVFNVFIAVANESDLHHIRGNCIAEMIRPIRSKISWGSIKDLRKIIKKHQIDILFSTGSAGLSNSLMASLGTKVKNVGYRGTQAKIKRSDITYYLGILNPRVKHVVCLTPDIKEYLSKFIKPEKLTVNSKPFDISWAADAYNNPKQIEGMPDGAFKIIYVAQTKNRPYKGLTSLIKAFQLLNNTESYLIFIGNYDDKDYKLAKQGVGKDRIFFLGQRNDAVNFLPKQDLFVLPSLRDAYPRSVREAMACGLPCIVSNIEGAKDLIVDGETGLLVPPDSPYKLAEAIRWMIDNKEKRLVMGKASHQRIINDFSTKKFIDTFEEIFKKVYSQK